MKAKDYLKELKKLDIKISQKSEQLEQIMTTVVTEVQEVLKYTYMMTAQEQSLKRYVNI